MVRRSKRQIQIDEHLSVSDPPKKEKRRGGAYDETEVYLNYSQTELMAMLERIRKRVCTPQREAKESHLLGL